MERQQRDWFPKNDELSELAEFPVLTDPHGISDILLKRENGKPLTPEEQAIMTEFSTPQTPDEQKFVSKLLETLRGGDNV